MRSILASCLLVSGMALSTLSMRAEPNPDHNLVALGHNPTQAAAETTSTAPEGICNFEPLYNDARPAEEALAMSLGRYRRGIGLEAFSCAEYLQTIQDYLWTVKVPPEGAGHLLPFWLCWYADPCAWGRTYD